MVDVFDFIRGTFLDTRKVKFDFVSPLDVNEEDAKQLEYRSKRAQTVRFDSARNACVNGTVRVRDIPLLQSSDGETWSE